MLYFCLHVFCPYTFSEYVSIDIYELTFMPDFSFPSFQDWKKDFSLLLYTKTDPHKEI